MTEAQRGLHECSNLFFEPISKQNWHVFVALALYICLQEAWCTTETLAGLSAVLAEVLLALL
jgi:hypothetical protein